MKNFAWLLPVLGAVSIAACGGSTAVGNPSDADGGTGADASAPLPPILNKSLGLNDVSILTPLPTGDDAVLFRASDTAGDGEPFLAESLVTRVTTVEGHPSELTIPYKYLQMTALRLDVCDRNTAKPCVPTEDGRLRVVYQPVVQGTSNDFGIHAFYTIPRAKLGALIAEFRALAAIQVEPTTSPLKVNPALSREPLNGPFHTKLRSILSTYASGSQISRLTVMGQSQIAAALRWIFHGMERENTAVDFHDITIPAAGTTALNVLLLGTADYQLTPSANAPTGMSPALTKASFEAATAADREKALQALVAAENPTVGSPATVQCATCHLSTILIPQRTKEQGLDPAKISGRFTAPYDLQVTTADALKDDGLLRGFGWRQKTPGISVRVINESAQVLSDLERQFPSK